jgi:hypothetical protein
MRKKIWQLQTTRKETSGQVLKNFTARKVGRSGGGGVGEGGNKMEQRNGAEQRESKTVEGSRVVKAPNCNSKQCNSPWFDP